MSPEENAGGGTGDGGNPNPHEKKDLFRELRADDTYQLSHSPCLLLGFRWDTATADAVCDLDAVTVFFDDNANALALVDCVQDTYGNVAALIDDSVYNMEGGLEDDLEKMVIDLSMVDERVTTIVAGVRSMSMTFKAHGVLAIKCMCASLRFGRFGSDTRTDLEPAWQQRVVSSSTLFSVEHETVKDQQNNVVSLFVIARNSYRDPWKVTTLYDEVKCRDTTALKHLMSGYVASPSISAVALKLPSIPALCAALTSKALPQMKDKFLADGKGQGLARNAFVHAVFMHLYQTTKGLHEKADAARVVAMLDELFDQIDINGNEYVDWEEFTSFCIELGIVSGKGANNAAFQPDDFSIEYRPAPVSTGAESWGRGGGARTRGWAGAGGRVKAEEFGLGPGVAFMSYVPELKLVYYAEKGSNILKALDTNGKPNHQYEFLDPYFVEGQYVTVHTVAYITGRYLAVVCNDHSVNLMKEVKNRRGCTHGYHCEAKVMHQLMHTKLMWEPCFQNLISVGADNHLYQWQLDDMAAGARRIFLRPEHVNTITDIVCIAEKELVATSSLDRRVCVWQMPTWKLRASFRDHALGVQVLCYLRGTLLSAGFDWDIIAWDVERLEKIGTMTGHKAPVTAVAQMVCPTNYEDMKAISADCTFETRIWDLSGCIAGGNTIPCLHVFRLSCPRGNGQGLKYICLPFDHDLSVKGYSNMLVGGQTITSYAAQKIKKEFFVPPAAEYNSSSAHFLSALRQHVHIWNATSGEYARKLMNVSPSADIVSACFALPFERRLIIGTEDGRILLVNYVTGAILDECQPHTAEVTQMVYCKETKVVISADYQGTVVITSEIQCKLKELRKVRDVHGPGTAIAYMAYSYRLSKIVTCSSSAEMQVLEFQNLDFVSSAVQSAGEPSTGLAFLDRYSLIILGDLTRAGLWHLDMETFKMKCFGKLSMPTRALGSPMDVMSSVGILRSEPAASATAAAADADDADDTGSKDSGPEIAAPPRADITGDDSCGDGGNADGSVAGATAEGDLEHDNNEGEVSIALGTEGGRLGCWALGDILESARTRESFPALRPVPDSLCPSLSRSFNPYSLTVKKGARRSVLKANARGSPNTGSTPSTPLATSVGKSLSAGTSGGVTSDGRAGSTTLSATATGESNSSARGAQGNAVTTVKSLGGDTCSFESEEDDGLCMVPQAASPRALWQGHVGPVARICSCSQPPCFFSLGEDGFQRIWSVEGKLLGQFALPNASEIQLKHRLFKAPAWSFLLDAVRVRPFHEEMTSSLLEEVEKRRAQRRVSSHPSSVCPPILASSGTQKAEAAGAAATTGFARTIGGAADTSTTITTKEGPGRSALAANSNATSPPVGSSATQSISRRGHFSHDGEGYDTSGVSGKEDAGPVNEGGKGAAQIDQDAAHRPVAVPRGRQEGVEAERRRAALEMIEPNRCHTAEPASAHGSGNRHLATGGAVASSSVTTAAKKNMNLTTAFSLHSVRWGATLGYYGRDEVNTLLSIARNPSRVAAYNRIVEGKQGGNGAKRSREPAHTPTPVPRRRPRAMSSSSSAPALLSPASFPNPKSAGRTDGSLSSGGAVSASSLGPAFRSPTGAKKRAEGSVVVDSESPGTGRDAATAASQSLPTRAVKMYRNAAREYGRGHSAGQAMWEELQCDSSTLASPPGGGSLIGSTRTRPRNGAYSRAHRGPATANWSSSSTFLELPEIDTGDSRRNTSGEACDTRENSGGGDFFDDEQFDDNRFKPGRERGGFGDGEQATSGSNAANDWFVATRHGRDDTVSRSKLQSSERGQGWEETYAYRRSAARRGMARSRTASSEDSRRLALASTSSPPTPHKWDWDWCRHTTSALPAERVASLFSKIDSALSGGGGVQSSPDPKFARASAVSPDSAGETAKSLEMAPCADFSWREETADSNSALGPAVGALQGGGGISEEGGGGEETVQARKAREAMMVKSRGRGPKGDGSGMAHLVSAKAQKRTKQLAQLEQKIIALIIKGNDHARRREAQERRRGHKSSTKKPLAKGPRPGQLGPHYTLQAVMEFRAAFNFVDEDMSGCLDSEEWRRFLDRFKSTVAVVNMRSMFLHLDKDMSGSVEVGELVPVIFNKASTPQHLLMRHLIEYENARDVNRFSNKMFNSADHSETLQLEDVKRLFELYDVFECGRLDQRSIRKILLALRVPQLSWDAFARNTPRLQTTPDGRLTADEFAAGFFEAFIL